jgi:nitroimidazol reductase NimA-like FMN-containing flavoprotein (pyridoxamine 5'-phosphate oxidase superfamily)
MQELRRKDKKIAIEEAREVLHSAEYGILSTVGTDGQPYGVPLNYVYRNKAIFFHCALTGHKLDNLESNPKVSFCVVGDTEVLPAKFSTNYVSVVVMGKASESQGDERSAALLWLLEKYSPAFLEEGKNYIKQLDTATKVIKIEIEHVCGKKAPAKA